MEIHAVHPYNGDGPASPQARDERNLLGAAQQPGQECVHPEMKRAVLAEVQPEVVGGEGETAGNLDAVHADGAVGIGTGGGDFGLSGLGRSSLLPLGLRP